jgi:transcriptional regulator with GAF, ATPase, and Fis domain
VADISDTTMWRTLEVAQLAAKGEPSKETLTAVLDLAIELAFADRGYIAAKTGDSFEVVEARKCEEKVLSAEERDASRSIMKDACAKGRVVIMNFPRSDATWREVESVKAMRAESVLVAPIVAGDGSVMGALVLHDSRRTEDGCFNSQDRSRIEALVVRIAGGFGYLKSFAARRGAEAAAAAGSPRHGLGRLVGSSPGMVELREKVALFAPLDQTVLIEGETGTGKELVARALHELSPRAAKPLHCVCMTDLPETLVESELFGHAKGAFTGATSEKRGLLLDASGSTLLLDEVSEMSLPVQARLLRFLQEKQVRPVGSTKVVTVDVRVVAATNKTLKELVAKGAFKQDLYYRLKVLCLRPPPLRKRGEDVLELAALFLREIAQQNHMGHVDFALAKDAQQAILRHAWPGNVRELLNALTRAIALGVTPVRASSLALGSEDDVAEKPGRRFKDLTQERIDAALKATDGNVLRACNEILDVGRSTFYDFMKQGQSRRTPRGKR